MARIHLSDGREIPVVKPHLGDQLAVERALNMKPAEFRESIKTQAFQTAITIFASFNRAGVPITIREVLEIDLEELSQIVEQEPGDPGLEPADESEGEQSLDPQSAPIGAHAAESAT